MQFGFWDDATPDENPASDEQGRVEVPAWRHAVINYPHPLLKQGLVVLDTLRGQGVVPCHVVRSQKAAVNDRYYPVLVSDPTEHGIKK